MKEVNTTALVTHFELSRFAKLLLRIANVFEIFQNARIVSFGFFKTQCFTGSIDDLTIFKSPKEQFENVELSLEH